MFLSSCQAQVQVQDALIRQLKIPQKGRWRVSAGERKLSEIRCVPFAACLTILSALKDPFIMGYRKLKLQNHGESLCERAEGETFGCIRAHSTWKDEATAAIRCNSL